VTGHFLSDPSICYGIVDRLTLDAVYDPRFADGQLADPMDYFFRDHVPPLLIIAFLLHHYLPDDSNHSTNGNQVMDRQMKPLKKHK
jgi:hypothetical protein